VIVVDSSEDFDGSLKDRFSDFKLFHMKSEIQSAAIQRNLGIDFCQEVLHSKNPISFLDDDIILPSNYFLRIGKILEANPRVIGVSGRAVASETHQNKGNWLTEILGLTGRAGSLTKAVVNIPPKCDELVHEVDWLIGCSTWRRGIFDNLRFESDFIQQSIFEDVIFSARAKEFGALLCDSNLTFIHSLSPKGRANEFEFYRQWTKNRYRLFSYKVAAISRVSYWLLNLMLLLVFFLRIPFFKRKTWSAFKGVFMGILDLVKERNW
jgi:hypothetical protein